MRLRVVILVVSLNKQSDRSVVYFAPRPFSLYSPGTSADLSGSRTGSDASKETFAE